MFSPCSLCRYDLEEETNEREISFQALDLVLSYKCQLVKYCWLKCLGVQVENLHRKFDFPKLPPAQQKRVLIREQSFSCNIGFIPHGLLCEGRPSLSGPRNPAEDTRRKNLGSKGFWRKRKEKRARWESAQVLPSELVVGELWASKKNTDTWVVPS